VYFYDQCYTDQCTFNQRCKIYEHERGFLQGVGIRLKGQSHEGQYISSSLSILSSYVVYCKTYTDQTVFINLNFNRIDHTEWRE
jgi:hypothetical protein